MDKFQIQRGVVNLMLFGWKIDIFLLLSYCCSSTNFQVFFFVRKCQERMGSKLLKLSSNLMENQGREGRENMLEMSFGLLIRLDNS